MKKVLLIILIFYIFYGLYAQRATLPYFNDFSDVPHEMRCVEEAFDFWESNCYDSNFPLVYWIGPNGNRLMMYLDLLVGFKNNVLNQSEELYANLKLDLTGTSNVKLEFDWWKGDPWGGGSFPYNANNAIFISDDNGNTFYVIYTFPGQVNNWYSISLNLSNYINQFGLQHNNQFIIRFKHNVSDFHQALMIDNLFVVEDDCPVNRTISENISGGVHEFLASNSIVASNIISNGANVHYGANNSVKLQTGFRVYPGVNFRASLNGCSSAKSAELDNDIPDSYDKLSDIFIYPNPAKGHVNVNITRDAAIQIFDSTGKIVYQGKLYEGLNTIDLSSHSKGVLVLLINDGKTLTKEKLILK